MIVKKEHYFRKLIKEEIEKLKKDSVVFKKNNSNLIYFSISKSYASAYANGQKSAAHIYQNPIKNGILFYVCLSEYEKHYGGDIWISGYKKEIVDELNEYIDLWDDDKQISELRLDELIIDFLYGCGVDKYPNIKDVKNILSHIKKDDLSIISPQEWSYIQEKHGGYSEICLKNIPVDKIIKIEIYENFEILKTIVGKYKKDCETIFYHGSTLQNWTHLL